MKRTVLFGVTLLIGACCLGLGFWQVGRLQDRRADNRAQASGRSLPPLVTDSGQPPALPANRRVVLQGELDEAREFLLRNRLVRGVPAVQVITPLRLVGTDTALLVNRGYVPAADAINPGAASWSESGRRQFRGLLLPMPARGDGAPKDHRGRETWNSLDLDAMRARVPYPIAAVYLLAETDSSEGDAYTLNGKVYPFRAEVPPMGDGPHLMYAVQWFGIAAAVVAFGAVFVLRGGTGRSADMQESPERGAS